MNPPRHGTGAAGSRSTADRLHSVAIHLLRHARAADASAGMSAARLSALSVLVFGGARTVSELAAAEQVTKPTMTRLLQGLERDGFVRRRRDVADGRVVRVSATARGRRALGSARRARVARIDALLDDLDRDADAALEAAVGILEGALGRPA
jgi:DNA-binding MarR family transcriptional regulator